MKWTVLLLLLFVLFLILLFVLFLCLQGPQDFFDLLFRQRPLCRARRLLQGYWICYMPHSSVLAQTLPLLVPVTHLMALMPPTLAPMAPAGLLCIFVGFDMFFWCSVFLINYVLFLFCVWVFSVQQYNPASAGIRFGSAWRATGFGTSHKLGITKGLRKRLEHPSPSNYTKSFWNITQKFYNPTCGHLTHFHEVFGIIRLVARRGAASGGGGGMVGNGGGLPGGGGGRGGGRSCSSRTLCLSCGSKTHLFRW